MRRARRQREAQDVLDFVTCGRLRLQHSNHHRFSVVGEHRPVPIVALFLPAATPPQAYYQIQLEDDRLRMTHRKLITALRDDLRSDLEGEVAQAEAALSRLQATAPPPGVAPASTCPANSFTSGRASMARGTSFASVKSASVGGDAPAS